MNEQNERNNENGMNPDSNHIENDTRKEESVNFVRKESQEQNPSSYEGPYRASENQYYNGNAGGHPQGNPYASGQPQSNGQSQPNGQPQSNGQSQPNGQPQLNGQRQGNPYQNSQGQPNPYQGGPVRPNYYQNPYPNNGQPHNQYQGSEPKRQKKKGGMAKKAGVITAAALLFGVVSGGTMVGINVLSNNLLASNTVETPAETKEVAPQTAASSEAVAQAQTAENAAGAVVMDVSAIVEDVMPSMVSIDNTVLYTTQNWFYGDQTYEVPSSGSGIIVGENDTELLIVTNNHVIEDSKEIKATFIDGTSVDAAIKGTDSVADLAVIAVPLDQIPDDTKSRIKPAVLGDSEDLKMGQGVIAIGNALGYGQTTTVGYISAVDRQIQVDESGATKNVIQTDAAINPGNSGGALVNMKGEVIGINEAKTSATSVEGVGYAIPVSEAQDIIKDLMNQKTRIAVDAEKQGYLGIQGTDVSEQDASLYGMPVGVFVYKVVEGGAASQSELQEKDIITKIDNQSIRTMEELKNMLTYYESGTTVTMTVMRLENGQYTEKQVDIVLGSKPEEETEPQPEAQPQSQRGFWR